jgi:hypothetical protein
MPPSRNNTVKFTDLQAISSVNAGDIIPVVDTSVPTLVNKKINVQDFSRSLPVSQQVAQMGTVSANWDSSYSTTLANSAYWGTGGSYGSVYSANSAEYESVFTSVNIASGAWSSAYSTLNATSGVYTTVQNTSGAWNNGSSAYTSLNALSSGTWLLKAGDQISGSLTTTKTLTTQFTDLDELVSKRYVDAVSTVSGNFVPSLYYTKANLETGIPLLSSSTLQTNSLTIGQAGGSQSGFITFDPNLFGTGVTGYTLNSSNTRSGIRVIGSNSAQLNYNEGGLGVTWGGPTFRQNFFTLGNSSGNNIVIIDHYAQFHPAPLTNSIVLRSGPTAHNFYISNYSNMFLDVPTVSGRTIIADAVAVQNDGRIYNAFASPNAHGIQFASNNFFFTGNGVRTLSIAENIAPGNGGIWMRSDRIVGWSSGGDPGNSGDLRLKRIGASSLALDSGGTANIPSFTVFGDISASRDMFSTSLQSSSNLLLSATGNITLSAGGIINLSQSLPLYFSSLSAGSLRVSVPQNTISSLFSVVSSNGTTLFSVNSSSLPRVNVFGNLQLDREIYDLAPRLRLQNNNNASYGELYMDQGRIVFGGLDNGVSMPGGITINPTTYGVGGATLLTLRGIATNPQSFIKCLSSNGTTVFEVNSAGSIFYDTFQNNIFDNFNVARFKADGVIIQTDSTGGRSGWNDVSVNNYAANNGNAALASARGQWNFPSVINAPTAFTLNNQFYLLRDISSSTDLICLSSNRNTAGFHFYGKSSVTTPASIFIDSDDTLNLRVSMGGGKAIRFLDSANNNIYQFGLYQSYMPAIQLIAGLNTTDSLRIIQRSGQTGSYIKLLNSSETTTVFEINSANNVVVKNLLTLGGATSTTPAIKGTSTTVQARTGDDSQYTFLQGKIQTDQVASAGTFTPDKYIILYDSTGTAYKVPVQAL